MSRLPFENPGDVDADVAPLQQVFTDEALVDVES